jgi:hypothetical protein
MSNKKPREPAAFKLDYRVTFYFKHHIVTVSIEADLKNDSRDRQIIANRYWECVESGDYIEQWVVFRSDEPFNAAELAKTCANIELLDKACDAMINGTAAEVSEAAFRKEGKHGRA